jgi:diguanylate cyclase (GGDEF)-like protein
VGEASSSRRWAPRLDDLLAVCPTPLVLLDREANCLAVSREAQALLDGPDTGLTGVSWLELVHPDDRDAVAHALTAATTMPTELTTCVGWAQASVSVVLRIGSHADDAGRLVGHVLSLTPLSTPPSQEEDEAAALALLRSLDLEPYQSRHDPLTGLFGPAALSQHLDQTMADLHPGEHVCLLWCDIDGMTRHNERLGHAGGDELLMAVAGRLRGAVRGVDVLGRIGPDEFVVLSDDADDLADIEALAGRLMTVLTRPYRLRGGMLAATVSLGIARVNLTSSADEALGRAEQAAGRARAAGPGRWYLSA